MASISEFERTKPVKTMKNMKTALKKTKERAVHADSPSEQIFLCELIEILTEAILALSSGE